jgi:uncharacterized repeat protein (TIGR01451 family)
MNLIQKLMFGFGTLAMAVMPFTTTATSHVSIESRLQVENTTTDSGYVKNVPAKVDEVVAIQVWYHNREEANSGEIANNLKVNLNLPQGVKGKTQVVSSTTSADNSNTVNDSATINLSLDNAYLEFIPGQSIWRHNTGTNANPNWVNTTLSAAQEQQLLGGGLVLENAQPCFNFESTVTVLARVRADVVSITKQVRKLGEQNWVTQNSAKPGDKLEYLITFKNEGNTVLRNVVVGDNMPAHVAYVNGTTMLRNGSNPNGIKITSDNITKGGIDVGNYNPGAVGYVWFQAQIDSNLKGNYDLTNVGVVRPEGMNEHWNKAVTKVSTTTPQTPPTSGQPSELPETGVEGAAAGLAGSGALGYGVRGYIRSRRGLKNALLNK